MSVSPGNAWQLTQHGKAERLSRRRVRHVGQGRRASWCGAQRGQRAKGVNDVIERVGTVARRAGGAARDAAYALVTVSETQLRWLLLRTARGAGRVNRWTSRGWFPTLRLLGGVTLLLLVGPVIVDRLSAWVNALGVWSFLDISRVPATHHWLSLLNLVIAFALLMAIRMFTQARRRVVVENFVDYTKDAETAVNGLATLLVAELGRLRGLYDHVNQQLSVSRSVGVQARAAPRASPAPSSRCARMTCPMCSRAPWLRRVRSSSAA